MATITLVEPYIVDSSANFTMNNLSVTSITANNASGTLTTGSNGQVLTSTGANKAVWADTLNPFLLMGA